MTAGTGEQVTDADLAARLPQDPELFTEVHDRYFAAIYRYAAGRLDTQTAEDIAAETSRSSFGRFAGRAVVSGQATQYMWWHWRVKHRWVPAPPPAPAPPLVLTGDLLFDFTSATVRPEARSVLVASLPADGSLASRLHASGRGESEPVDTNGTPAGRRRNRRVELGSTP
ncbi:hypothetical protein [Amycolatopsis japonica]|uniref:hypothetical protein n=1 Tax=Amycolatopsis japonica TaxID=208439 RepID=UPI00380FEE0D